MDEVYRRNLLKKAFFPWRTYSIFNIVSPTRMDMSIQFVEKLNAIFTASTNNTKALLTFSRPRLERLTIW